ncbi:hypothetical protein TNCV_36241 [Trichonephila clavipes]|nr:hypothetical protein TNCV_36241 [Trichonephila clavipes]
MGSCLILETTLPVHQGESNAISLGDKVEILDETGLKRKNQDDDIPRITSCFVGHDDESRMPKFRQPCVNGYAASKKWIEGLNKCAAVSGNYVEK